MHTNKMSIATLRITYLEQCSIAIKESELWSQTALSSNLGSTFYQLCDPRQLFSLSVPHFSQFKVKQHL